MMERPAVLVLGAGASAEYGFPTGQELLRQMLNYLDPQKQGTMEWDYLSILVDAGFSAQRLVGLRSGLDQKAILPQPRDQAEWMYSTTKESSWGSSSFPTHRGYWASAQRASRNQGSTWPEPTMLD